MSYIPKNKVGYTLRWLPPKTPVTKPITSPAIPARKPVIAAPVAVAAPVVVAPVAVAAPVVITPAQPTAAALQAQDTARIQADANAAAAMPVIPAPAVLAATTEAANPTMALVKQYWPYAAAGLGVLVLIKFLRD